MFKRLTKANILIIDAGLGNIGSVQAAIDRLSSKSLRLRTPPNQELSDTFTHAILPGVGSFASGIDALEQTGWGTWIKSHWCHSNRPFLGICLGMQLMATEGSEGSHDHISIQGLNLIPGRVNRLDVGNALVLPHVGWNSICWESSQDPLCTGLPDSSDMYFVHSYAFETSDLSDRLAITRYGNDFASVIRKRKCYGVQFHPEKSQRFGSLLLKNFLQI